MTTRALGAPSTGWQARMGRTRRAIQTAALHRLTSVPYDEVTVAEIAAAAGVSTRTVFRYYPTKEAIVVDPWPEEQDHLLVALWARPADEHPVAALRAVVTEYFTDAVATDEDCRRVELVAAHPALRAAYLARVERFEHAVSRWAAVRADLPLDGLDARVFAAVVASLHRVVTERWAGSERGRSYADLALEAFASAGHGPLQLK